MGLERNSSSVKLVTICTLVLVPEAEPMRIPFFELLPFLAQPSEDRGGPGEH
jgi:hypothetical protein